MTKPYVFTLPGGLFRTQEILDFAQRIKQTGKPVQIRAYDQVQGLQWNGGRLVFNHKTAVVNDGTRYSDVSLANIEEAVARVQRLNDAGIPFNIAFNNNMESIDVDDDAGNYLLQKLHNGMNGITLATESLRRHIRANYPNYALTASICYTYTRLEEYQAACKRFEDVVLMPVLAYEDETLKQLPADQLIFILNDICYLFCLKKDHYDYISRCNLSGNTTVEEQAQNLKGIKCFAAEVPGYRKRVRDASDNDRNMRVSQVLDQDLKDPAETTSAGYGYSFNITGMCRRRLIQLGVRHFKLQGREYSDQHFQSKVLDFTERIIREEIPG